jgi:hypothetical protein
MEVNKQNKVFWSTEISFIDDSNSYYAAVKLQSLSNTNKCSEIVKAIRRQIRKKCLNI